jgi:hypothetical protein
MIKRLAKVVLVIVLLPLVLVELPYYGIRWIVNGNTELPYPLWVKCLNWF